MRDEQGNLRDVQGKKKILLVDDDHIFHDIAYNILSDKYNVITSTSGKEALILLVKHKPDLIFLDILMPEMDGWETFHKIRGISILHQAPIAFITSINESEGLEHAKRLGAIDYFTKPLVTDNFLKRIDKIMNSHVPKAGVGLSHKVFPEI